MFVYVVEIEWGLFVYIYCEKTPTKLFIHFTSVWWPASYCLVFTDFPGRKTTSMHCPGCSCVVVACCHYDTVVTICRVAVADVVRFGVQYGSYMAGLIVRTGNNEGGPIMLQGGDHFMAQRGNIFSDAAQSSPISCIL